MAPQLPLETEVQIMQRAHELSMREVHQELDELAWTVREVVEEFFNIADDDEVYPLDVKHVWSWILEKSESPNAFLDTPKGRFILPRSGSPVPLDVWLELVLQVCNVLVETASLSIHTYLPKEDLHGCLLTLDQLTSIGLADELFAVYWEPMVALYHLRTPIVSLDHGQMEVINNVSN
jgi:hypothetical protein